MGIWDVYPIPSGSSEIHEPPASEYSPEHRSHFVAQAPPGVYAVVSGSVNTKMRGREDENAYNFYDVRLLVGPFWKQVRAVVPYVTITKVVSINTDEDDLFGLRIHNLTWDTVNEFGPSGDELRIRLKMIVAVAGAAMRVDGLGYHVFASGRAFGDGGLNEPGPVVEQG